MNANDIAALRRGEGMRISSRRIAEIAGKRHHHVLRDIEKMFEKLKIAETKFGFCYKGSNGQEYKEYLLTDNHAMALVMNYSVVIGNMVMEEVERLRAENARMREMFAPRPKLVLMDDPAYPMPTHLEVMEMHVATLKDVEVMKLEMKAKDEAKLVVDEKVEVLEMKVMEDAPKLEFYEALMGSDDAVTVANASKLTRDLKLGPLILYELLRGSKYLMCRDAESFYNKPTSYARSKGWFILRPGTYPHPVTKEVMISTTTYVTPLGLKMICETYVGKYPWTEFKRIK